MDNAQGASKMYSSRERKALSEKIRQLGKTEHNELLRMLISRNIPYTQNSNGVFVNMSAIDNDMINEMENFVIFCMENMQELEKYDQRLNDCKKRAASKPDHYPVATDVLAHDEEIEINNSAEVVDQMDGDASTADSVECLAKNISSWDELIDSICEEKNALRQAQVASGEPLVPLLPTRKKACTKFIMAKKKYSKKKAIDVGKGQEVTNVLVKDA